MPIPEKKQINIQLGINIKTERERAKYTQAELAELIGVTTNQVSVMERGMSGTSLENIKNLCMVLGVSADILLFGRSEPDNTTLELVDRLNRIEPKYRPELYEMLNLFQRVLIKKEAQEEEQMQENEIKELP